MMFDTFKRLKARAERKELHCIRCRRVTIHTLEARCRGEWGEYIEDAEASINGSNTYSIYRCGACDAVCFEDREWFSEDGDGYTSRQYPPVSSASFTFDTEFVEEELSDLIDEMLYALEGSKLTLAAVGLRIIVEWIVNEQGCSGRNLALKIEDLRSRDVISLDQEAILHRIREKGNAGAHEARAMTQTELVGGMGVINLLLEKLYNGPAREKNAMEVAHRALSDGRARTPRKPSGR